MLLLLRLSLLPLPLPPTHYGLSLPSPSPKPLSLRFPPRPTFPLNPELHFAPRSPWRRGPGSSPPAPGSADLAACDEEADGEFDEELARLLVLLPEEMRQKVEDHPERRHLVEIVMDLGRRPLARLPSGDFLLSDRPITSHDLHHATSQVGDFATDNRAGISRTLHRISAIRNRKGAIIGLTCRVGRAVSGSANLLRDLVKDGGSLLLIGPPGVGKTTIIRDIARTLADDYRKRVMIVDTSNEIGGDGDIPHAGIGSARRMQVPNSDMQHKVLIEAIENHMPQVIVIDEIGTKLEAMAASTIAQRGIQLVATAHGITIENLVMNPSLEMLVGGIQSVTLGDEEANRRGVQKTVLERKGPSTFTCGAEIISKTEVRVHHSLEATVDALLAGRSANFEVWKINPDGSTHGMSDSLSLDEDEIIVEDHSVRNDGKISDTAGNLEFAEKLVERSCEAAVVIQLYVYGISETSVLQAIKQLEMDGMIILTDNISQAHVFLALHSKLKKNSHIQAVVKSHGIPIYVTKTISVVQITKAIRALVKEHANGFEGTEENRASSEEESEALEEARLAIEQVVIPRRESVQLLPRPPLIISAQMDLIDKYHLDSEKIGCEPDDTCLRILPLQADLAKRSFADRLVDASGELEDLNSCDGISGSQNGVARLPLLPE